MTSAAAHPTGGLELVNLSCRLGSVQALEGVHLGLAPGEIHALVGENGAGKTTLLRIAVGLQQPDRGTVRMSGRTLALRHPQDAAAEGIGMVHQHFALVEAMTVAENLHLTSGPRWFRSRDLQHRARDLIAQHGLTLDPARRIAELSVGERQRVEILKALSQASRVLLLDEPTAALTPGEIEILFSQLRQLSAAGLSLLLVTHKLAEVMALAQQVTVLRKGRVVHQGPLQPGQENLLAARMSGAAEARPLEERTSGAPPTGEAVLRLQDWRGSGFGPLHLAIRRGEIVSVAGVAGNGQTELAESIVGLRTARGLLQRPDQNVAYISGDRQQTGLALDLPVAENLLFKRELLTRQLLPRRWVERHCSPALGRFAVQPAEPWLPIRLLSGGNQQKVVLGRELQRHPELVIAENPARGLDLRTTAAVHEALREARDQGAGVLLFSTDLDEVLALGDRVLVAYRGQLIPAQRSRQEVAQKLAGWSSTT